MKISDWKTKVLSLFRPAQHDHAPVLNGPRTLAAIADRKPVGITVISTGERFVHAPSLEDAVVDPRYWSPDSYHDDLERAAADGLKRWNGNSVRDIDTERFYDHPHLETHTALQGSVPKQARAERWNPAPQDPGYRSSITVLAVDQLGEALVKEYVVDDARNAEGWSYSVMSADRAAQLLLEYGAAADLTLGAAERLQNGNEFVQAPNIGATYRGEILSIEGDTAYQRAGQGMPVAHWLGALAVTNPQQYVGKEVEISYPCGKVGLLRQVDALALDPTALQKPGAEKSAGAFER
ncbi:MULTISPECIES: KfrB domain-containing protein [Achromobacter]|uniref:KfrB domain-containing protein n=2 Tax=Achromobacter TaxID=222 RepID=A0AAW3HXS3_9BURK|nr:MULTISPECIES: hypothetical protein [Achromobacter]KNE24902.1 hypothetical protein AFM18_24060 [Achromobacter spanius]MDH2051233.1 hypothetical protein [Achromobacter marplatensis]